MKFNIEKMVGTAVEVLGGVFPRWKTKIMGAIAIGMVVCQYIGGWHTFDVGAWAAVGMGSMATVAMRNARKNKGEYDPSA